MEQYQEIPMLKYIEKTEKILKKYITTGITLYKKKEKSIPSLRREKAVLLKNLIITILYINIEIIIIKKKTKIFLFNRKRKLKILI